MISEYKLVEEGDKVPENTLSLWVPIPISIWPKLPETIISIEHQNSGGKILPKELPKNLQKLNVSNCRLGQVPKLPDNLDFLSAAFTHLYQLPEFPPKLTKLIIADNYLTSLPKLPESLQILNCAANLLTTLPELQPNLHTLIGSQNKLQRLPLIPDNMKLLVVGSNKLTYLPAVIPKDIDILMGNNLLGPDAILRMSEIRKKIIIRRVFSKFCGRNTMRRSCVFELLVEIACRPSGTIGTWDQGGETFRDGIEEVLSV